MIFHPFTAFFTPGTAELVIIFVVILIFFGPRRLPEIARTISRTLNQLRRASQDFKDQVMDIDSDVTNDIKEISKDVESSFVDVDNELPSSEQQFTVVEEDNSKETGNNELSG